MAKYAYRINEEKELEVVDASDVPMHSKETFFCTTPGCNAKMFLRTSQKKSACFVSYSVKKHTGGYLCHVKGAFDPDIYDERKFSLEDCFNTILSPVDVDRVSQFGKGAKGSGSSIPIRSLRMLYLMCVQFRKGGSYNGYIINDILVDQYNPVYQIIGRRIVACTFYRFDNYLQSIFMNHPAGREAGHLRLYIPDKEMYKKCTKKLIDRTHSKLFVIAGEWKKTDNSLVSYECIINSIGKQICKGD